MVQVLNNMEISGCPNPNYTTNQAFNSFVTTRVGAGVNSSQQQSWRDLFRGDCSDLLGPINTLSCAGLCEISTIRKISYYLIVSTKNNILVGNVNLLYKF